MKPFAELTGTQRAIELLRWLLVPVAAVLAVALLIALVRLASPPAMAQLPGTPRPTPTALRRYVLPRVAEILLAVTFVLAGALTAPRRRTIPAAVLAALWTAYSFLLYIFVHIGRGTPHYLDFAISAAAAGGAAWIIYAKGKNS